MGMIGNLSLTVGMRGRKKVCMILVGYLDMPTAPWLDTHAWWKSTLGVIYFAALGKI